MNQLDAALTRRTFLAGLGAATLGAAMPSVLFAHTGGSSRLVVVILRGALDGLAAVPPYGDPAYAGLHRDLAIAPAGAGDGALPLNATFGLHPSLAFLHERYAARELIVLHAIASPYRDRSHFDGQNILENGLTKPIGSADGWLNRMLRALDAPGVPAAERAIAISQNIPLILRGEISVLSKSASATPDVDEDLLARLADLYSTDEWFSARLSEAVQTDKLTEDGGVMAPTDGKKTGADRIGAAARMAAAVMTGSGGPQIAVLEASGWDTHANQGGAHGTLAQRLAGLDQALRGFADDFSGLWSQTAMLVVTEFGRTAAMNGTRGTDHGTGTCAFLLGGAVNGGRVLADWPGLEPRALLDARDLRPTLDLRSLFKGVLSEHLRVDTAALDAQVFPDSSGVRPLRDLIRA